MNLGLRVMKSEKPKELEKEVLETVEVADVRKLFGEKEQRIADFPIDEDFLTVYPKRMG